MKLLSILFYLCEHDLWLLNVCVNGTKLKVFPLTGGKAQRSWGARPRSVRKSCPKRNKSPAKEVWRLREEFIEAFVAEWSGLRLQAEP